MAKTRSLYGIDAEHTLSKDNFIKDTEQTKVPLVETCTKTLLNFGKNIGLAIFIFLGLTSEVIKDNVKS